MQAARGGDLPSPAPGTRCRTAWPSWRSPAAAPGNGTPLYWRFAVLFFAGPAGPHTGESSNLLQLCSSDCHRASRQTLTICCGIQHDAQTACGAVPGAQRSSSGSSTAPELASSQTSGTPELPERGAAGAPPQGGLAAVTRCNRAQLTCLVPNTGSPLHSCGRRSCRHCWPGASGLGGLQWRNGV